MKRVIFKIMALIFVLIPCCLLAQPKVVFDTDIDSDVDDVGALAMLLNMHNNNEITLAAIIVTSDDPYAPLCVSAMCDFYTQDNIPIGFLKGQEHLKNHSRYARQISEQFPVSLKHHAQTEDGVELYRRILAESKNNDVTIITVGHLSSLMQLLQSSADEYSKLSGLKLAHRKVRNWYCMGGQYPSGKEANFYRPDPLSTYYCLQNWRKPVVFCGWEIGNKILSGGERIKQILPEQHPVYQAYKLYNNFASRPSWDQLAVYMLCKEFNNYFEKVDNGYCQVNEVGENCWVKGENKFKHSYIRLKDETYTEKVATAIDAMMCGVAK